MPKFEQFANCKDCGHQLREVAGEIVCKNVNCPSKSKNPNFNAQHERYLDERARDSNR